MGRKAGFAGVIPGCLGSAYLLGIGISTSGGEASESGLMVAYGILSLLACLLAACLLKNSNWIGALYCGIALTIFSLLGIMSVGLFLLPGSFMILVPSAIRVLESR